MEKVPVRANISRILGNPIVGAELQETEKGIFQAELIGFIKKA
jgi:hypothetical protein